MPLIYQQWITRADLQANPDVLYVFGDNTARAGLAGQAKEMRGEPNAVGIATKWVPSMAPEAYFSDSQFDKVMKIIMNDLLPLEGHLLKSKIVVWPLDGIGTGLSRLPQNAPKIWEALENRHQSLRSL